MKRILTILFVLASVFANAQYNPSIHVTVNDALGVAQATPSDSRSMYFNSTTFVYRNYASRAEILSYLYLAKYRAGKFPIFMDSASRTYVLFFRDGTADANLVYWNTDASTVDSTIFATNYRVDTAKLNLRSSIAGKLQNTLATGKIWAGDISGNAAQVTPGGVLTMTSGGSYAYANNSVTYSKIQQIPGQTVIGNPDGSTGNSRALYLKYGFIFDNDSTKIDTTTLKTVFGASSYSFENGLTNSSGTVKLGGLLTENTTIDGDGLWFLKMPALADVVIESYDTLDIKGATTIIQSSNAAPNSVAIKTGAATTRLKIDNDGVITLPTLALTGLDTTTNKVQVFNTSTKAISYMNWPSTGGTGGITALTGDVGATGPGSVTATIQPNAVTYGKMQAMTANKLLGSGASGTAVAEITLGTGLSFSGTTLNATGGGSSPELATQRIGYGNASGILSGTGSSAFTVDTAARKLHGDTIDANLTRQDTATFNPFPGPPNMSELTGIGHSIIDGTAASDVAHSFLNLTATYYGLPVTRLTLGGSGIWRAASNFYLNVNPGHSSATIAMTNINDIRRNGFAIKTHNKILSGMSAVFVNQFLATWTTASNVAVTRVGAGWAAGYTASTVGGKSVQTTALDGGVYSPNTNDSLIWTSPASTSIAIGLIGSDGATPYAQFRVVIDGVVKATGTENNMSDGVNDGINSNTYVGKAVFITGLSNTTHTVSICNTNGGGSNYLIVDYFGTLVTPVNAKPLIWCHDPYLTATGYATVPANANNTIVAQSNTLVDSMVTVFQATGLPVYVAPVNDVYDTTTGCTGDGIHPNDAGMAQIKTSIVTAVPAFGQQINPGTFGYATNGFYYGNDGTGTFPFAYKKDIANLTAGNGMSLNGLALNLGGTVTQRTKIDGSNSTKTVEYINLDSFIVRQLNHFKVEGAVNIFGNNTSINLRNGGEVTEAGIQLNDGTGVVKYRANTGYFPTFESDNAERARISLGGNLLLGTTSDVASSIFTVVTTTQGTIPIPRMTQAQMNAISSPAAGLMVWNTDSLRIFDYDGSAWHGYRKTNEGGSGGGSDTLKVVNAGSGMQIGFVLPTDTLALKTAKGLNSISVTTATDSTLQFQLVNDTAFTTSLTDYVYGWDYSRGALGYMNKLSLSGDLKLVQSAALYQITGSTYSTGGYDKLVRNIATGKYELQPGGPSYFTPATGGTVTLSNDAFNIINPAGTLATLTVNLPGSPADGDYVEIKFTQIVSAVTFANGTIADGITAPSAGGYYKYVYRATGATWY